MENEGITLTPDFTYLFDTFARETRLRAGIIQNDLPEPTEAKVALLRVIHGLLVPLNISAQSMHNAEAVNKYRELIHEITQSVEVKANEMESAMTEQEED